MEKEASAGNALLALLTPGHTPAAVIWVFNLSCAAILACVAALWFGGLPGIHVAVLAALTCGLCLSVNWCPPTPPSLAPPAPALTHRLAPAAQVTDTDGWLASATREQRGRRSTIGGARGGGCVCEPDKIQESRVRGERPFFPSQSSWGTSLRLQSGSAVVDISVSSALDFPPLEHVACRSLHPMIRSAAWREPVVRCIWMWIWPL